jgi:hypothetical protein
MRPPRVLLLDDYEDLHGSTNDLLRSLRLPRATCLIGLQESPGNPSKIVPVFWSQDPCVGTTEIDWALFTIALLDFNLGLHSTKGTAIIPTLREAQVLCVGIGEPWAFIGVADATLKNKALVTDLLNGGLTLADCLWPDKMDVAKDGPAVLARIRQALGFAA